MKKLLSLVLCLATIFSSVAFCFPAIAAELDFGVETGEDYATLPAEESEDVSLAEDLVLPLTYDFEDGVVPDGVVLKNAGNVTLSIADKGEGKALQVNIPEGTSWVNGRVTFDITQAQIPAATYRATVDFGADSYPADGYTFRVYYTTLKANGSAETKQIQEIVLDKDQTITVAQELTEPLNTFGIQYAIYYKGKSADAITFTLDNFKFEEIPTPATILFDANGGEGSQASIATESGATVELPEETTFTRNYYDFLGWGYTADAAKGDAVSSYKVVLSELTAARTKTFYAIWQRRTYDVDFDFLGGNSSLPTSYTINEGETKEIKLPTASEVKLSKNLLIGWMDSEGNEYTCGETVTVSKPTTFKALWLDISGFSTVSASKASGYDGKTTNVDPRYPGAYYYLPVKLDNETVSVEALNLAGATGVEYFPDEDLLVVYPSAPKARVGTTFSYPYTQTTIMTADQKSLLALPAVSYTLASNYAEAGYENLIPYGDTETEYFPYYTGSSNIAVGRGFEEDGNHFAHITVTSDGNAWPHTGVPILYENGATYKFTGRYRRTGAGSTMNFCVSFNAQKDSAGNGIPMPYSKPTMGLHANNWNHQADIGNSTTWKEVAFEFTVNKTGDATEELTIYSNPSGGKVTTYDVDDFALYKRMDVTYSEGTEAKLADGKTAPATHGVFFDGSGTVTKLASECPYVAISSDWQIDAEKPWLDQYGNTYALGEEVDLDVTGPLNIVPNLTTDKETYTISFNCDGLKTSIAPVKVIVGETLDFAKVEDVVPVESYVHFNGWSTTGLWEDVLHGKQTISRNMTLYPVISKNFDFAVKNNRDAFTTSNAKFEGLYKDSVILNQSGSSGDVIMAVYGISIPATLFKGVNMYVDTTYTASNAETWTVGKAIEGLYFGHSGESPAGARLVGGKVTEIDENGIATIYMNACTHSLWNGTITFARFDPLAGARSMAIRGIEFVYGDVYDEKEIALSGLTAPISGHVAVTSVTDETGITESATVTWSPSLTGGRFDEMTSYTASIALSPKLGVGKRFAADMKVMLNGEALATSYDETTGVLTATKTFEPTEAYKEFSYEVVGPNYVLIDGNATKYHVNYLSDEGIDDKSVTWSVDDETVATIDASTGALTPIKDGTVVVTATSVYNLNYSASLSVDIDYYDFLMNITGPDFIQKAERTTQYRVSFDCEIALPDQTAVWSVESGEYVDGEFKVIDGAEYATISDTGRLVPSSDGFVRVRATSNYHSTVSATKIVEITNQAEKGTITYHAGTTDTVTGLPEVQEGYGTTELSTVFLTRADKDYTFLGWAASDESADLITSVMVPSGKNVDVYAVWGKGKIWTYGTSGNSQLGAGGKGTVGPRGVDYDEITTSANDYRITYTLNLDAQEYSTAVVRIASEGACTTKFYYKTTYIDDTGAEVTMGYDTNGFAYAETQSVNKSNGSKGLDDFKSVTFNFLRDDTATTKGRWSNAKTIVNLYLDPCKSIGMTFRLSSVSVLAAPTVTFDANTTDTVTGMPSARKVAMGGTINISEKPVREGYAFAGWSKSPTDRSKVKTSFGIAGDVTLYAVWDKNVDTDPDQGETGDNEYKIPLIEASQSAVLVKVGTHKGVQVSFACVDNAGSSFTTTETTNANGYAVIDLSDLARPITDAVVTTPQARPATSIILTDIDSATATANKVTDNKGSSSSSSGGSSGGKNYGYDTTVTDVKNDGKQYEVGSESATGEAAETLLSASKKDGDILFNFEEDYEKDLFKDGRQMTQVGMNASVLTIQSNGKKSGSNDSPAYFSGSMELDAASHKYIVIKAKHTGLANNDFRIYFHGEGAGFSEANAESQKLSDGDYSMLVYDMGAKEGWKDKITALFFSLSGDVKGTIDIDWVLFTNKVPESMDDVSGGAKVNFPVVNKGDMPFTDVASGEWFHSEIANAYKLGFVEGTSATTFEPNGSVTIAEAITLAVRLNYIYNEKTLPKAAAEGEWFKPFVDAAVRAGIIKSNQFAEYDVPALRKQVAAIMAKALPSEFYEKMNMFTEVPDLDKKDSAYSAVLKLYNAGIVIGSDDKYNFLPESDITRAEIAAIVNRIANPANRKRVVTEAEIESKKKRYTAEDIAAGCSLGNCTANAMVVRDGAAWATGKTNDPIVYLTDLFGSFNGKDVTKITFGLKWDPAKVSPAQGIFFTTPSGGWAAERFIKAEKSTEHENGVTDFVVTTSNNAQFANTITGIRFDPFDAAQEFGIAYIIVE